VKGMLITSVVLLATILGVVSEKIAAKTFKYKSPNYLGRVLNILKLM
jgi:hypothetical protein